MIQKFIFLFLLLILSALATESYAQKFVAFDKRGRNKRIRFYQGSQIHLKLTDKTKVEGSINRIDSTSFLVNGESIRLKDVAYVYQKNTRYGLNILSTMTFIAGVGYVSIDTANRLINDENPVVNNESLNIGLGFLGVSLLSRSLSGRRYKINENRPLKIIDLRL